MQMKDSKISWIGKIPDHWKILPNKYIFNISKNIVDNPEKYQLLSLTTKGVKDKDENDLGGKVPDNYNGYQRVNKGDLILCLFDLDCSAVFSGLSNARGMISPAYKIVNTKVGIGVNNYFKYLFAHAFNGRHYKQYSKSLRFTVNSDEFLRIKSIVPPIEEQLKIANYLDEKCGEIDGLISEIEKEIEVLTQYKKSIITETVTRGLKKDIKLKKSKISWIVQIPEHWEISKIKYNLSRKTVRNPGNAMVLSLYREYGIVPKDSRDDNHNVTSEDTSKYLFVKKGQFVINKMKAWQGSMAISKYEGIVSPAYYVYDVNPKNLCKEYLHYLLKNPSYIKEFRRLSGGVREGQWDLPAEEFENLLILIPPIQEQKEIAEYLDKKCKEIDSILEDKNKQLETLESYKKSIIYEYVTGKKEVK